MLAQRAGSLSATGSPACCGRKQGSTKSARCAASKLPCRSPAHAQHTRHLSAPLSFGSCLQHRHWPVSLLQRRPGAAWRRHSVVRGPRGQRAAGRARPLARTPRRPALRPAQALIIRPTVQGRRRGRRVGRPSARAGVRCGGGRGCRGAGSGPGGAARAGSAAGQRSGACCRVRAPACPMARCLLG